VVRTRGRIGTTGQDLVESFANEDDTGKALEAMAQAQRRRSYQDL
jgi:predicted DNA-binding WGR domain protein